MKAKLHTFTLRRRNGCQSPTTQRVKLGQQRKHIRSLETVEKRISIFPGSHRDRQER